MTARSRFSVNELAALTKIKDYGDITMVTIPGCSRIPDSERAAIFARAQHQKRSSSLSDRLRRLTPPLDDAEETELSRSLEQDARLTLENDGCPPCYPPDLETPLHDPPEEYKAIVRYWQFLPSTEDMVLCAQLSEWRSFRICQSRLRGRYGEKSFDKYVQIVRDRLKQHGLDDDVNLCADPTLQTGIETWTEYLHYHVKRMEQLRTKQARLKQELSNVIEADSVEYISSELKYAEGDLGRHKVLLAWIENERRKMVAKSKVVNRDNEESRNIIPEMGRRTTAHRYPTLVGQKIPNEPLSHEWKNRLRMITVDHKRTHMNRKGAAHTKLAPYHSRTPTHCKDGPGNRRRQLPEHGISSSRSGPRKMQDRSEKLPYKTRSGRISKAPVKWAPR